MTEENTDNIQAPEKENLPAAIEALLIAHGEPVDLDMMMHALKVKLNDLKEALQTLEEKYLESNTGVELQVVAGKYQIRTKTEFTPYIQRLKSGKPRRLSPAALETLAVIAYRQPVVKSDIEKIRGVDVTPTLKTLSDRDLIKVIGHQATVGQPALYATTDEFLKVFGLDSLESLPVLRELKEIEQDPGEASEKDIEAGQELATIAPEVDQAIVNQTEI